MPARLDPFVDVLLREQADQLYLLPDEPVTLVKDGKPRKVSRQPLTDAHIYALLAEVAPSEAADLIDQKTETEFEYAADRGLVRVRVVPETGRLTAVISPKVRAEVTAARPGVKPVQAAPTAPAPATPGPSPAPRPLLSAPHRPPGCRQSSPTTSTRRPSNAWATCCAPW